MSLTQHAKERHVMQCTVQGTVQRDRCGHTVMEAVVALAVMTTALALVAQLAVMANRQLRRQSARSVAVQEAANVMDQVLAIPWADLEQTKVALHEISPAAEQQLPGAQLQVTVTDADNTPTPRSRRVIVEVTWGNSASQPVQRVRLVSWAFAPAGGKS